MAKKDQTIEWAVTANVYEINVRQYTPEGTFEAFEKELPRLKDLGVEIIWFMPVTPISVENRQGKLGSYYAVSDYTAINSEFGTIKDFKQLVKNAHKLGFKVLIDWVANHTGYDHIWTTEYPEFYKKNEAGHFYEANGWVDVIDLDYSNNQLWNSMVDAMNFWVKQFDIDGFRCDMAHLVPLEFWRYAKSVLNKKKKLFWLGECEVPEYHEVFDATYAWELLHTMEAIYKNTKIIEDLKAVLTRYDTNFPPGALRLLFTSNHDENSHSGSEYERLGHSAKAFAVLCATWKNSLPLIYSGQELPNGKQLKFFEKDEIEWTNTHFLHGFYKSLLTLRKNNSAFITGNTSIVTTTAQNKIFAFKRTSKKDEVIVLLNLSDTSRLVFGITDETINGTFKSLFFGITADIDSNTSFELQKWEYAVYYKVKGTPKPLKGL